MNVIPIQNPPEQEGASCSSCGASLVADQRYCLACGQPCSPVRLAFLDVLQTHGEMRSPVSILPPPVGYPPPTQDGALGWLRHYAGLLALLSVLLTTGLIGLLIGHWTTPLKAPAAQVLKIEGGTLPAAAVGTTPAATAPPSAQTTTSSSPATEAQEVKEVKEVESKAKTPPPVKTSSSSLKKLEKLTGKRHQQAIEALTAGGKPIETGG